MCLGVCFGGIKIERTITINSNILEVMYDKDLLENKFIALLVYFKIK